MARWKKALVIFLIYYALLFIGATIIMYIEAAGLERDENNPSNSTKIVDEFFMKEFNLQLNMSKINRILQLSQEIALHKEKNEKTHWKRKISWKTMYKWRYFTHTTLTTVGKAWHVRCLVSKVKMIFDNKYRISDPTV